MLFQIFGGLLCAIILPFLFRVQEEAATRVSDLQTLFENMYRETFVELQRVKTSIESMRGDVVHLRREFNAAQSLLRNLSEDATQNKEDLKALNEFGLNKAGFHLKPSKGYLSFGQGKSGSLITAYNVESPKIHPKCQNVCGRIRSVNTQNGCLRLYNKLNCRGLNMMAVPGLYNHGKIRMTFRSVGPCTFVTKHP